MGSLRSVLGEKLPTKKKEQKKLVFPTQDRVSDLYDSFAVVFRLWSLNKSKINYRNYHLSLCVL